MVLQHNRLGLDQEINSSSLPLAEDLLTKFSTNQHQKLAKVKLRAKQGKLTVAEEV